MSDIVDRLKSEAKESDTRCRCMCHEAAAEIERLRARVAELEGQHKGLVIQNAILRSRPDLPADRIPAANRVAGLEADRDRWEAIAEKRHAILLDLEWVVDAKDGDGSYCPYCMSMDDEVHVAGCKMAEAIAESARVANWEVPHE